MKFLKSISMFFFIFCSIVACVDSNPKTPDLKFSNPADGQEISSVPETLELVFNQAVKLTQVDVFDVNGEQVKFAFMLSPRKGERFEIPPPEIKPSSYKIKWSAMQAGKKINGELSFSYKATISD